MVSVVRCVGNGENDIYIYIYFYSLIVPTATTAVAAASSPSHHYINLLNLFLYQLKYYLADHSKRPRRGRIDHQVKQNI